jgi:SAM-dependent methyltransferase
MPGGRLIRTVARKTRAMLGLAPKAQEKSWRKHWQHDYERQLTDKEISTNEHRDLVGGMWAEIGSLQFEFIKSQGLLPNHRFLDVGCGSLRGGVHFMRYLEPGHYYGIDMNPSLIRAGREVELPRANLTDRNPHLLVNEAFEFSQFRCAFRYALALSVFTHIGVNAIQRCLVNIGTVLGPGGKFFATYFPAPHLHSLEELCHAGKVVTHSDADPFHYHPSVFEFLATNLPLAVRNIGEWGHPRGQFMLEFTRIV